MAGWDQIHTRMQTDNQWQDGIQFILGYREMVTACTGMYNRARCTNADAERA